MSFSFVIFVGGLVQVVPHCGFIEFSGLVRHPIDVKVKGRASFFVVLVALRMEHDVALVASVAATTAVLAGSTLQQVGKLVKQAVQHHIFCTAGMAQYAMAIVEWQHDEWAWQLGEEEISNEASVRKPIARKLAQRRELLHPEVPGKHVPSSSPPSRAPPCPPPKK